ncbi:MAG: hypothetical protein Q8P88_02085 [Candidatus Jorgensenbacteria bacterium]|nr:hypothetical protein [Candidatus Jorgensenbacteria bacterium]
MKKVLIYGAKSAEIGPALVKGGFEVVTETPDMVVSYGGDGTLMKAEHDFPGVPKLPLKGSRICKLCTPLSNEEVLRRVSEGAYTIEELWKLTATQGGRLLTALNDIIIHNSDARHAIRYTLTVNGRSIGSEIIGDGVVIATPFGSTGYYRSITDSFFEVGMGLAFNNSTEQSDHMVLREGSVVKISIVRGPAVVYADNQEDSFTLEDGEAVVVEKSKETAKIVKVL